MTNADQSKNKTESAAPQGGSEKASDDRQARLSKALRDNLRRRKAQVRARKAQVEIQDQDKVPEKLPEKLQDNVQESETCDQRTDMLDAQIDAQADEQKTVSGQEDLAAHANKP
nr:hypothetical protein [uncultured Cohaesibacter sp.]